MYVSEKVMGHRELSFMIGHTDGGRGLALTLTVMKFTIPPDRWIKTRRSKN
jgi:hypothetical protein